MGTLPITGLMTTFASIVMFIAWMVVRRQIHRSGAPQRSVVFLGRYFLFMALFCLLMSVPYFWLGNPEQFSLAMAIGYVVGHVFCYLAFMNVTRMVCSLVPWLVRKDIDGIIFWLVLTVAATAMTAYTMIWGTRPVFDFEQGLTLFNVHPVVGIAIALMSLMAITPALVLFGISTWRTKGPARIKPLLIFIGFAVVMIAGPLHDVAPNGTVYALADFLSALSMVLLLGGVLFHFERQLSGEEPLAVRPVVHAPSNTI